MYMYYRLNNACICTYIDVTMTTMINVKYPSVASGNVYFLVRLWSIDMASLLIAHECSQDSLNTVVMVIAVWCYAHVCVCVFLISAVSGSPYYTCRAKPCHWKYMYMYTLKTNGSWCMCSCKI